MNLLGKINVAKLSSMQPLLNSRCDFDRSLDLCQMSQQKCMVNAHIIQFYINFPYFMQRNFNQNDYIYKNSMKITKLKMC